MDVSWLAAEAKTLHVIFQNVFYVMVTTFLCVAVVLEYFKLPLGQLPEFPQLVGRVFVACVLMVATPEIMNMMARFTDGIVTEVGHLIEFKHVLERLSDKLGELSWNWVSVKDTLMIVLSYLTFLLLYVTVYIADAIFLFAWMLIYVFSPIVVALYVFPMTAGATKTLYRSMIEVCTWKIIWTVLCALLWSMALSDINDPKHNISFLTVIILNLMLVFSVILAPRITSSFLNAGISDMASMFGNHMLSSARLSPEGVLNGGKSSIARGGQALGTGTRKIASRGAQASITAARQLRRTSRPHVPQALK